MGSAECEYDLEVPRLVHEVQASRELQYISIAEEDAWARAIERIVCWTTLGLPTQ